MLVVENQFYHPKQSCQYADKHRLVVRFCNCSMFCCALLCVHSNFAIILMGKRELVALLCLSSWCLVMVVWLFLTVPWVCLQFVIVVFPDHTHYFCNPLKWRQ